MKRKIFTRLSIAINILLVLVIIVFVLKYEVKVIVPKQYKQTIANGETFDFLWPANKSMALSLTFDDARISQIDSGITILDKYGVKATFYVSPDNLENRLEAWKKAIVNGHEIGNHTTTHPCSINFSWTQNSLENYSITDISNDITTENEIIKKMLGIQPVSFAYPCGLTFIGAGLNTKSYVPVVSSMFESGRLYLEGSVNPVFCDMAQLPSEHLDNKSFNQIKELIENAKKTRQWLILSGHDIGEGNDTGYENQTSSKKTIEAICKYANDPSNGIWIDNVHNIASYIKEKRCEKPFMYLSANQMSSSSLYSKLWSIYYITKMKLKHYKHKIGKILK